MTTSNLTPFAIKGSSQRRASNRVPGTRAAIPSILFLLALLAACNGGKPDNEGKATPPSPPTPSPVIVAVHPDGTDTGKKFNVQPNGASALAITCQGASNHAVIVFGGDRLATIYGGPNLLTAEVDPRLYAKTGSYQVYLEDNGTRSNSVIFTVR